MSVARNASATTSLPNPAALTPAGTGRSNVDSEPPLAGRAFALSLLLLDTVFGWSSTARRAERRHPTGLRARCPTLITFTNLPACCNRVAVRRAAVSLLQLALNRRQRVGIGGRRRPTLS